MCSCGELLLLRNKKILSLSMFPFSSYQSYHFLCICFSRFETCWPALMKDSHGVIIIFNPDMPSHLKEIEMWYSCFVQQQPLLDSQCLLVAHHKPGSAEDTENLSLGKRMENTMYQSDEFFIDLFILKIGGTL